MSKLSTEYCQPASVNHLSKSQSKNTFFKTLDQENAISYLVSELNQIFEETEQPIEKAFDDFLDVFSRYHDSLSKNRKSTLAAQLSKKLREHHACGSAVINSLLEAVDESVLNSYIEILIKEELKTLTTKSPYRCTIEKFYHRWNTALQRQISLDCGYGFRDYIEKAMEERCEQLEKLRLALDKTTTHNSINSENPNFSTYADDELISTVASILADGKIYSDTRLILIPNHIATTRGFNQFLEELKHIEHDRISKTLVAHDATLSALDFDLFTVLQELHVENSLRPYAHQMFPIVKALVTQNVKSIQRFSNENEKLMDEVTSLTAQVEDLTQDTVLIDELESENVELRSRLSQLERQVQDLNAKLNNSKETKEPNPAPAISPTSFSISMG